jgi:serine phosphatase RsbU (regulator of sigma subunit)
MQSHLTEKEIADSIKYASNIQAALLPDADYFKRLLPDSFILNLPRDVVSGDFYWISQVKDRIAVTAADCTGHGVPGAFMSIMGINFLNQITSYCIPSANKVLNQLREYVMKALHQTGMAGEQKDGIDMSLCVIDTEKNTLEFAGAQSPLFYFRNGQMKEIKGDRMPIGVSPLEEESFTNHTLDLKDIDSFYIFSDGYSDQFGGKDYKKLKMKGFREIITQIHNKKIGKQVEILVDKLDEWKGDNRQIDDILVLGIRLDSFKK